jgi:hypothetical protein
LLLLLLASAWLVSARAHAATDPLETVEVTGSRAAVRKEIQTFVSQVTRLDGELIGRWRDYICPLVVGVSDEQAQFIRNRLVEVQSTVRKHREDPGKPCKSNLFVIITDDADFVIEEWKQRDPGMFRWKTRAGVSRSNGAGPVRAWHNAIVESSDDGPTIYSDTQPPQGRLKDSRIQSSVAEHITAVVLLVDGRATGPVTLAQLADYLAMVSLSQIDLGASLGNINSILRLFAEPRPATPPTALTEWDYAFLNALYRASYSPAHQRADINARMVRELAPR